MKVDAIAVRLRPRSMNEAADLGIRLVQGNAKSVWRCFAPVYALVALIAFSTFPIANWLPALIILWLKPWLDRTLLFVLSRAIFGMPTQLADVWAEQSQVWWRQWAWSLTARRLSPWRSYTQPMVQLEGQGGDAGKARRRQLLRGKGMSALGMQSVFAMFEELLVVGIFVFAILLAPADSPMTTSVWELVTKDGSVSAAIVTLAYAGVVLLVEPFFVGAGFAMYLNRRVELEAWDIEQEFRLAFGA